MGIEIERKFLLANEAWRTQIEHSEAMAQGYLGGTLSSVRVRIADHNGHTRAHLNIKSKTRGTSRLEFEYEIPVQDAREMIEQLCEANAIIKTRHHVCFAGQHFEIDEFLGENLGLIVAELELTSVDQTITKPDWLGTEVTEDVRFYNASLVEKPYCRW